MSFKLKGHHCDGLFSCHLTAIRATIALMKKPRHNLYFHPKLYKQIKQLAKLDMRSFNSEVMVLLAYAIEQRRDELKEEKQEENYETESEGQNL